MRTTAPGNYTLVVANFGSQDESVATQIILSERDVPRSHDGRSQQPGGSRTACAGDDPPLKIVAG